MPTAVAFPHAAVPTLTMIAVGDSYASGEGAKRSGWIDNSCHRSALAGPQQAATLLNSQHPTNFISLACSGSVIEDATDPAHQLLNSTAGNGQLSRAVSPTGVIDALTISIACNDLRFGDIVAACANPFDDCSTDPNVTAPLVDNLSALQYSRLDHLITAIQGPDGLRQVPSTVRNVYITEYPDPTTGTYGNRCGSSSAPTIHPNAVGQQAIAYWLVHNLRSIRPCPRRPTQWCNHRPT